MAEPRDNMVSEGIGLKGADSRTCLWPEKLTWSASESVGGGSSLFVTSHGNRVSREEWRAGASRLIPT